MNARLSRRLRLAVVTGSRRHSGYVDSLLARLQSRGDVDLAVLVIVNPATRGVGDLARRSLPTGIATTLLAVEAVALRILARTNAGVSRRSSGLSAGLVDLSRRFLSVMEVSGGVDGDENFPAAVRVAGLLDLVIMLDSHIPIATCLGLPCRDVLQLELGSSPTSSGELVGFREVSLRLDQTPVNLYRLAPDGTRIAVIAGFNRTKPLFSLNQAAAWDRLGSLLIGQIEYRLGLGETVEEEEAAPEASPLALEVADPCPPVDTVATASSGIKSQALRTEAALRDLLIYPMQVLGRGCGLVARQVSGRRNWSIAIMQRSETDPFAGTPLSVEPPPKGSYHADPFLYFHPLENTNYCFVEEFDKRVGRAHISVLRQERQSWSRLGAVLTEPFHLSFPFVFEYAENLYMCPEMCGSGEIGVYKCVEFPLRWERCATLMKGVSATDTMLLQHNGRWWMLTNLDLAALPDHQCELHVFYADSPLSGTWMPIKGNPVKVDCHGARNGGIWRESGRLFRFGQVQTFEGYGRRLQMYEITHLSSNCYRERYVQDVPPPFRDPTVGMHTYSSSPGLFAIDTVGAR